MVWVPRPWVLRVAPLAGLQACGHGHVVSADGAGIVITMQYDLMRTCMRLAVDLRCNRPKNLASICKIDPRVSRLLLLTWGAILVRSWIIQCRLTPPWKHDGTLVPHNQPISAASLHRQPVHALAALPHHACPGTEHTKTVKVQKCRTSRRTTQRATIVAPSSSTLARCKGD